MSGFEIRLREMSITLPTSNPPAGNYVRAHQTGKLLFVSGHLPGSDGTERFMGKLDRDLTASDGYQAARSAAINALGAVKQYLGDVDRVAPFREAARDGNQHAEFRRTTAGNKWCFRSPASGVRFENRAARSIRRWNGRIASRKFSRNRRDYQSEVAEMNLEDNHSKLSSWKLL